MGYFFNLQVIQGIQNGPYKNIYNPENFFVGSQGSGAANNWAAGYAAGDTVQEEVFDMIDREADGSDSLEVQLSEAPQARVQPLKISNRVSCFFTQLLVVQDQVLEATYSSV